MNAETRDGPPKALLIAAVVVAAAAIIAILVVAALRQSPPAQQAVPIPPVPAPQADSAECKTLLAALPQQLGDYHRAPVVQPAPPGTAAWTSGDEPVILRCGLDRPAEFVVGSALQVVDEVQWFQLTGEGRSTWLAVDRAVYIALTLPQGSGPTPIQEVSDVIAKSLPAKQIDPAPVG
ncbi:DUF3515 domain-containing protein [Mycobacterium sp. 3519A]|uniref:DUF3515 domain-containing protein n=1 Tax=Mycobacterium sp. 3519A TaxID=2057184 RepID=UPI000C7CC1A5|nr:DUF3515 domain-containing protein [Mycobacterium sp. 3519A]